MKKILLLSTVTSVAALLAAAPGQLPPGVPPGGVPQMPQGTMGTHWLWS